MEKFLRRPIALSADVVFLMDPTLPGANPLREHIEWIEERKREGKRAIALNLADNHNYPLDALVDACAETIRKSPDACFVLIPHAAYARPNLPNENVLMERVLSKLSPADAARCRLIRLPFDPRALQEVLGHIDFGICGRMHLAIGLLSAGVPASCIGYQNKFDGLLVEYLRMPELLLDMEAVFAKGDFGDVLRAVLPSATDYSERIRAELPELRRMAAKNFAD
jgi:polysaccharide pyruvyl transferase WcaK-like protein